MCVEVVMLGETSEQEGLLNSSTLRETFVITNSPPIGVQLFGLDAWRCISVTLLIHYENH
jgi:hypothetical protein